MVCSFLNTAFAEFISKNYVDDLMDYQQVSLIFLAESPHTEEVNNGIPLFGGSGNNLEESPKSGNNLRDALKQLGIKALDNISDGFGKWLRDQHLLGKYKHIGIMNVSNIRLDNELKNTNEDLKKYINVLKFIKDSCTRTDADYVEGDLTSANILTQLSNLTKSIKTRPEDILKIQKLINDVNNNQELYQQILNELATDFYYRLARIKNHDCCFVALGNFAENFYRGYYDANNGKYIKTFHPSDRNSNVISKICNSLKETERFNVKELFEGGYVV